MAATLVITLNSNQFSINDLNSKAALSAASGHEAINALMAILSGASCGQYNGTLVVTTRDTTPTVATSGSGSLQNTITI